MTNVSKISTQREREAMERDSAANENVSASEQTSLAKLDNATRMLAEVRDAPSAKRVMDLAAAAEYYARKAKLGEQALTYAQGIKYAAEIKLGEYLKATPKAPAGRPKEIGTHEESIIVDERPPTLAELGISKKLSSEAQRLADLPDEAKEKLTRGEIKPSVALRDLKRSTLADRIAALPVGKYRVIYADPPWKYGDERAGLEKESTAAAAQYPTMPTANICALDVPSIAADDAVLFMWATFPLLTDGLAVMKAWDFDYKTAFVWDKQRSNIGNYHDARAELLLIGLRGSCPIEIDTRPKQVQSIARGKHSAKPEEFRQLIDRLYPTGPAIELFRRGTTIKTAVREWKVWGNEANDQEAA